VVLLVTVQVLRLVYLFADGSGGQVFLLLGLAGVLVAVLTLIRPPPADLSAQDLRRQELANLPGWDLLLSALLLMIVMSDRAEAILWWAVLIFLTGLALMVASEIVIKLVKR
jgi:hypothetical protein